MFKQFMSSFSARICKGLGLNAQYEEFFYCWAQQVVLFLILFSLSLMLPLIKDIILLRAW